MAQIIHEHVHERPASSGAGWVWAIVALVLLLLVAYYGLPAIRNIGGTTVNVPRQIDVNVNQPAAPQQDQPAQ